MPGNTGSKTFGFAVIGLNTGLLRISERDGCIFFAKSGRGFCSAFPETGGNTFARVFSHDFSASARETVNFSLAVTVISGFSTVEPIFVTVPQTKPSFSSSISVSTIIEP